MTDEATHSTTSTPWSSMVDYERADSIIHLLKQLSNPLFAKDDLKLVEQEQVHVTPSSATPATFHSLLICGRVGHNRREAFLHVLRDFRLRHVQDAGSCVSIGHVNGDRVPPLMLCPLSTNARTQSYRLWRIARAAMRCGILGKMLERRQLTRDRLEQIIKESLQGHQPATSSVSESQSAADAAASQFYGAHFNELTMNESEDGSRRRFAPLSFFQEAVKTQSVDLSCVAASRPTVFVMWSCEFPDCMESLKAQLFNSRFLEDLRARTGLSGRFAAVVDSDPWVNFFEKYTALGPPPKRPPPDRRTQLSLVPNTVKRGQIVFINVDRDQSAARAAYKHLLNQVGVWRSTVVDILSLWAGPDGLEGELAMQFTMPSLPCAVAAQPARRDHKTYNVLAPTLVSVPDVAHDDLAASASPQSPLTGTTTTRAVAPTTRVGWAHLSAEDRDEVVSSLQRLAVSTTVPFCFTAHINTSYEHYNPFTDIATKALRATCTSRVELSGLLLTTALPDIRRALHVLAGISDFTFTGQLIQPSLPLTISLDPMTPRRYVRGISRVITCSACHTLISVDDDAHFRCFHCAQQDGILCVACFRTVGAQTHAQHHIFLRIPPCLTELTLDLVWGPSNVLPLPQFSGVVLTNKRDAHMGIYCDRCRNMVRGMRYKCAMCVDYDLCGTCFEKRASKELAILKARREGEAQPGLVDGRHELWHPMLCVRHGLDGDSNAFLRPCIEECEFVEYINRHLAD